MKKLSELHPPALAGVVKEKSVMGAIAYHASGEAGMLSRIINPVLGGLSHFALSVTMRRALWSSLICAPQEP